MPLLQVAGAAFLWGLIGIFVKAFTALGLTAPQISALRGLSAFVFMLLWALLRKPSIFTLRLKDLWLFFGTGVLSFTMMNIFYFSAIEASGLTVAAVLLYTSPVFITLLSAVFFGEKINALKGAALILAVLGCALVSGWGAGAQAGGRGLFYGLMAGFSYGLYSIFGRAALNKGYLPETLTLYTFAFAALGALPLWARQGGAMFSNAPFLWVLAALLGLCCTVLPFFLYSKGLQGLSNTTAGVTACLEPVVAATIGLIFYGESLGPLRLLGMAGVISAVVLLNLPQKTQSRSPQG